MGGMDLPKQGKIPPSEGEGGSTFGADPPRCSSVFDPHPRDKTGGKSSQRKTTTMSVSSAPRQDHQVSWENAARLPARRQKGR